MKEIYLDNSATTAVCKSAVDAAVFAMQSCWGNPSSLYKLGMDAESLISKARRKAASLISCREDEIFFTGCGTESNNTAIFGAAEHGKKRGNRIVTTAVEHPSVARPMDELEKRGFEVVRLPVGKDGKINEEQLNNAINKETILVSIMLVNNETGAIMPVEKVAPAIKRSGAPALFHCDAVQAFGKLPIDVNALSVDLLSASGHKLHAPKGIGLLYKSKATHIPPYLLGGGQESGFRSGTESVPLIAAFGGALTELGAPQSHLEYMKSLRDYGTESLKQLQGVHINSPADALPYIINISLEGYRSETLLHFLEAQGIYVSSGSACSKGKASRVLTEMGLPNELADSALRISMCRNNKPEDFDILAEALRNAQKRLRRK